jgi:energy-coupling factor transport system permease protein
MKIHTYAWLAWLTAGLVVVSTTRNPFYLVLLVIILFINQSVLKQSNLHLPVSTLKISISILLLSSLLNAFISHFGDTVLVTIPGKIPMLSGPITLEAIVYGLINGLVLIAMFTFFTILNSAVPVQNLVRLIPRAFHPIAVVTTIALTFIPATQQQFLTIREAHAMRGQRLQKLRDWLPLFIPLLIGGLERAMQIAEAMTARGYTVQRPQKQYPWHKIILPTSLILIIGGWLFMMSVPSSWTGWLIILMGVTLLAALFFLSGRRTPKTYFFRETWNSNSYLLLLISILVILLIVLPIPGQSTLSYNPYPILQLPLISIPQINAILLLIFPAFLYKGSNHD